MLGTTHRRRMTRRLVPLSLALFALVAWLATLRHAVDVATPSDLPRRMLAHSLGVLEDPARRDAEIAAMRATSAEWDLMWRTYTTLALADWAVDEPKERDRAVALMDLLADDAERAEARWGQRRFLLPYAAGRPWVDPAGRSVFVDGEILLMRAMRQLVQRDTARDEALRLRASHVAGAMERAPRGSAESYGDECWTYSDAVALAGLRLSDEILGADHRALARRWVASARASFTDRRTGLLVASHSLEGVTSDGVEGSSAWMTAHALLLVDPVLAEEQWTLAREALVRRPLGFAYAREWPAETSTRVDIDSGPVVPGLGAGPASSGIAFVAAQSFGDRTLVDALRRSLEVFAVPVTRGRERWYAATGAMGHAVVTYGLGTGSAWRLAQKKVAS